MLLRNASLKSVLISLGALALPTTILWFIPFEAGTPSIDFLRGLRDGLSGGIVAILLVIGLVRLIKGRWPGRSPDERDRMISIKAGAAAFYSIGLIAMVGAVALPVAWPLVTVRLSMVVVVGFIGISVIYAMCRIVAELRS